MVDWYFNNAIMFAAKSWKIISEIPNVFSLCIKNTDEEKSNGETAFQILC